LRVAGSDALGRSFKYIVVHLNSLGGYYVVDLHEIACYLNFNRIAPQGRNVSIYDAEADDDQTALPGSRDISYLFNRYYQARKLTYSETAIYPAGSEYSPTNRYPEFSTEIGYGSSDYAPFLAKWIPCGGLTAHYYHGRPRTGMRLSSAT
jgi:hypothetical protein